ncbi:MAG: 4-(cytidine 5'-diphospho)-2-C-methyl-D-erythritol kinase [Pseudomonadota bacterium]|nr:4-(cytidine 5'-diphospho)-2-C-methyl-D-erythritol kinase [Pseudomonadota bacterium]
MTAGTDESFLELPAPAKLNLFLHVTGRRADGYHTLQTVFQFIDCCDRIRMRRRSDGFIRRVGGNEQIPPEADLICRAAHLLKSRGHCALGADLAVEKRIPVGGGLGGGSSDAATVLLGLNYLWQIGLTHAELAGLGLQLGADVPVFVQGAASWAEGVGECLTPMTLPEPVYLVLVPPCHVATGRIFGDPELTRNSEPIKIADFVAGRGRNDCLPVVRRHYPEVAKALDWLDQSAPARLTGTGACVFAEFSDVEAARGVLAKVPPGLTGFVSKGLNRSPLHDRLAGLTSAN